MIKCILAYDVEQIEIVLVVFLYIACGQKGAETVIWYRLWASILKFLTLKINYITQGI